MPICPGGSGAIDVARYRRGELGIAPYSAGLTCGKPLGAAVGERIAISFTAWDMYDAGDTVSLYDGPDANAPLLGTWVGSDAACHAGRGYCDDTDAPWAGAVHVSSGASLFVAFVSSAHGNGGGWAAKWRTLARCHTSLLGSGWSSTNRTLALMDDDADSQPLLSDSHGSVYGKYTSNLPRCVILWVHFDRLLVSIAAVESEIFSRTCVMEGDVFAACLSDGSWAAVTAGDLSNPVTRPMVCSPPPPPPPPPPSVPRPPPPPGPAPPHVILGGCPRGTYRASGGRCVACSIGYFQPSDGFRGSACTMCPPGRYRNDTEVNDGSRCDKCPVGSYIYGRGAVNCRQCPDGRSTPGVGATGLINCTVLIDDSGMHFSLPDVDLLCCNVSQPRLPPLVVPAGVSPQGIGAAAAAAAPHNPGDIAPGEGQRPGETEPDLFLRVLSWFAWAGGATREVFLTMCLLGGCLIKCVYKGCAKAKKRCGGDGNGGRGRNNRTLSRPERQQRTQQQRTQQVELVAGLQADLHASIVHAEPRHAPLEATAVVVLSATEVASENENESQRPLMLETTINPNVVRGERIDQSRYYGLPPASGVLQGTVHLGGDSI